MRFVFLALLASGPAHGYELKRRYDALFGAVWDPINVGQIYVTLGRLERDGLVTHTEVPQALSGQGIGSRLAKGVFEQIRASGRKVVPRCSFMAGWVSRHPEYDDIVAG